MYINGLWLLKLIHSDLSLELKRPIEFKLIQFCIPSIEIGMRIDSVRHFFLHLETIPDTTWPPGFKPWIPINSPIVPLSTTHSYSPILFTFPTSTLLPTDTSASSTCLLPLSYSLLILAKKHFLPFSCYFRPLFRLFNFSSRSYSRSGSR